MSFLTRVSSVRLLRRAFTRVINIESVPAFDKYDHLSNMKTEDLFEFEPFSKEDLITFPREQAGKDYDLNWSLASEWFTVWGNAFRNPDRSILMSHLKCIKDNAGNSFCKRSYISDCDVPALSANFEELSDEVKEFLSKVPNLYVEDAAVSSGRLLEARVRSVTNDPATALVMKNVLHRMPLRHPQTPHPLSLIVARGMDKTFTAIGEDPHSRSLTVLAGGNVSPQLLLKQLAQATEMYYDRERGMVDMPSSEASLSIKGPLSKVILPCSTLISSAGDVKVAFGLPQSCVSSLVNRGRLFSDGNTVLSRDGVSRVFAGACCQSQNLRELKNEMVLNQMVYRPIAGDNLLVMPNEVFFVENEAEEGVVENSGDVLEKLKKCIGNAEYATFAMERLQNAVFRKVHSDSVERALQ